MAIYIPIPEPIEVYQWLKNGDIPGDGVINDINSGAIVGRSSSYKTVSHGMLCPGCNRPSGLHGLLRITLDRVCQGICPGDWVRVHRDNKKRITHYSVITAKVLHQYYVDLATIPQPSPQKVKPQ